MAGGSSNQGSQISSSEPWKPIQGDLKNVAKKAGNYFDKGKGFGVYGGDWSIDPSAETNRALGGMTAIANRGNPLAQSGINLSQGLMGGQYDPDTARLESLYDVANNYAGTARRDLRSLLGRSNNDAFQSMLDTQIGKLGDDITRQFGGSSFGSGSHTGMLGDVLGEARTKAAANEFYNQANLESGLLGQLSGVDQNLLSQRSGLAGAIAGLDQQGVQNRLAGQGIADQAYQSQYLPADRLAQVGATREGYDAASLQGNMDKYNARQAAPWQRLGAYSGMVGGAGGNYGTTTSTVSTPSNPWASALGGGLLGAQALGPLGGLGGGLLGLLSG